MAKTIEYTIMEAKVRLSELKEEISYLQLLTDDRQQHAQGVIIGLPKGALLELFMSELSAREFEYSELDACVEQHVATTKFTFTMPA